MLQVKIFEPEYSIKTCEKEINQWLAENSKKEIIDIKIVSEGSGMRSCAMIIYES